jgi:monoamine oxidase
MTITRREMLQWSAAAGAFVAVGVSGARPAQAAEAADVIVIGAGAAGLYAALQLKDAGYKVIVLEATDRAGGRCHTADFLEKPVELGASQMGADYARVLDVAGRFGLKTVPGANINAPFCFVYQGQLIAREKWASADVNKTVGPEREVLPPSLLQYYLEKNSPMRELDDWLKPEAAAWDISTYDFLKKAGASDAAIEICNAGFIDPDVYGRSALRQLQEGARMKRFMEALGKSRPDLDFRKMNSFERAAVTSSRIVGGTQRVTDAIAKHLGDAVRLNLPVGIVDMRGKNVEVTCAQGERFTAKHIISAVPFTALRRITILPTLPPVQDEAVREMPYGRQSQVFLRVKGEPYWEKDGLDASIWTDGPVSLVRQQIGGDVASGDSQLTERWLVAALAFGHKATQLDRLAPRDRAQLVMDYLGRIRPSMKGALEYHHVHSWEQQQYIWGCSHDYLPGKAAPWSQEMIKPHRVMHFAGEHTRRLEVGLESAMEGGERAALEIVEKG